MSKKRNSWREEPFWHWDWPGRPQSSLSGGVIVGNLSDADAPKRVLQAVLYLPDPDSESGWQLHQIVGDAKPPALRSRLGF